MPFYLFISLGYSSRYELSSQKLNFNDARKSCILKGGDLVSNINTSAKHNLLISLMHTVSETYIGLYDTLGDNVYSWLDGSTQPQPFWSSDQPSRLDERCVSIWKEGWNDVVCYPSLNYFCEGMIFFV